MEDKVAARERKTTWQRNRRATFKAEHGYSDKAHYGTGMLRAMVLNRDNNRCVVCGMTDEEHKAKWGRPITVDHIDRNRQHNTMDNLQTLCLHCHGAKDISRELITPRTLPHKEQILTLRSIGATYRQIAASVGISVGAAHKWIHRWEGAR
jgi:hypothetical protein